MQTWRHPPTSRGLREWTAVQSRLSMRDGELSPNVRLTRLEPLEVLPGAVGVRWELPGVPARRDQGLAI